MTYILALYALANLAIIYYFFIHKSNQADKTYERKLKEIYK